MSEANVMLAIRAGDVDGVRAAVAANEGPLEPRYGIGPPIRWAAEWGRTEIVLLLLEAGEPLHELALLSAASHGHTETVAALLKAGAPIDEPTWYTPLMAAADGGWDRTVQLLLVAGANTDLRSGPDLGVHPNRTALEIAQSRVLTNRSVPGRSYEAALALLEQ